MCGLVFSSSNKLPRMLQTLSHRGLPGRGFVCGSMGHIRLPIQGLGEEFDQPVVVGDMVFAFVGEVFNFKEIDPEASCDTSVVIKEWLDKGVAAFNDFDGFWSFLAWNSRTNELEIVTDHLAKKPLYLHTPTGSIASEIKPLTLLDAELEYDPLYFSSVEKWGYHIGPETPIKTIKKIPPSTYIRMNGHSILNHCEWTSLKPDERIDIRYELEQSVKRRLIADVPVSILLSGGIDSTIIFELIKRHIDNITVYHIDNRESEYLKYIDFPTSVNVVELKLEEVSINDVLLSNEGPVDLGSMLPQFQLGQAIHRDGGVVALSGDGADELFGGYRRSAEYDSQYSDIFQELVYYHLPRLDKLMMAHTVELRNPFLSPKVIQGALSLPYFGRIDKKTLKELFSDIVPEEIIKRKKEPLKSPQVRQQGLVWIRHLSILYKEAMNEYHRHRR